jgi:hypothetical protein
MLLMSASALAAPVARRPPLNHTGKDMVKYVPLQSIPDATAVSFPVYPDSYFERMEPSAPLKKGALVQLVLVSNDSPARVEAWYAKHLKGLTHYKADHKFAPAGEKNNFAVEHVFLHAITPQKLNPTIYELPHVKTEIMLNYIAK